MSEIVLSLSAVEIRYGASKVVEAASFDVRDGEFVTLLGPSGSGKTSLLRAIAGFVPVAAGEVRLLGHRVNDMPAYERDVGLVFQNYALFPHMTVAENLSFGPRMMKLATAETATRVDEALQHVRLGAYAGRYPHELSGGQQQRVAIARALAMRSKLLLLDEPMSNLDARLRAEMRVELVALLRGIGATALSVTHNQEEALAMSDRVIVMAEGGIRQIGTPGEIYRFPADAFVAGFIGDANVIEATFAAVDGEATRFTVPWGETVRAAGRAPEEGDALLLLRPESVGVCAPGEAPDVESNRVRGRLVARAYMGAYVEMRAALGGIELVAKVPADHASAHLALGNDIVLHWRPDAVRVIRR